MLEKVCWRRSAGEVPSKKVRWRWSAGEGSMKKGRRRRFVGESQREKVRWRKRVEKVASRRRPLGKVVLIPCEKKK